MSKIIKQISKLILYVVLSFALLAIGLSAVTQIPSVQAFIKEKILAYISDELGVETNCSSVQLDFLHTIRVNDLIIYDENHDTLLYSEKAKALIPIIKLNSKNESEVTLLRSLKLDRAKINLITDSKNYFNLKVIIDFIEQNSDTSKNKKVKKINKIKLTNSTLNIINHVEPKNYDGIGVNFKNIELNNLNINVKRFTIDNGIVSMDIHHLKFEEKSGFQIKNLQSHLELSGRHMHYSDFGLTTPGSNIMADSIKLSFSMFKDLAPPEVFDSVYLELDLTPSSINMADIGYFSDFFYNYHQDYKLSGNFKGKLSNLKGKEIRLNWGGNSALKGSFDISGLPNTQETFLIFNLDNLSTNVKDIDRLNLPGNKSLVLPDQLKKLKNIIYEGNFTGFLDDFVAYGTLKSKLGNIKTDIMFSPNKAGNLKFSGRAKTEKFQIGEIFDIEPMVGGISMNAEIVGAISKENPIEADISGNISYFKLNQYPYQGINVNGSILNKTFNGSLKVDDPNLKMDFDGLIDLNASPRVYNFVADIIDANLYELNISKADTNYHASFFIKADAKGNNLDDLNGKVKLLNSIFIKSNKQIQVYDLELEALNNNESNNLIINSDLLDAEIIGKYQFSSLKDNFKYFLSCYLSNIFEGNCTKNKEELNTSIDFKAHIKRSRAFFDFFFPKYHIDRGTKIHGTFNTIDGENEFNMDFISNNVIVNKRTFEGLNINVKTIDSALIVDLGSKVFAVNKDIGFENFTLLTTIKDNSMTFENRWNNWDTVLFKGNINAMLEVHKLDSVSNQYKLKTSPSSLVLYNDVWHIDKSQMIIDSSFIEFENLKIWHKEQNISFKGTLSDKNDDSLKFNFKDFDLTILNDFSKSQEFSFNGILSGNGFIKGWRKRPIFLSSFHISDLQINGQELGDCDLTSIWNNETQALSFDVLAQRGKLTYLKIGGQYYPYLNQKLDFDIKLDKLKTNIFNPFLSGVFSDMRGWVSGKLKLAGFAKNPNLSGELKLFKNALTINYLKTRYNFTTNIEIVNNHFIFDNIKIYDEEGNTGVVNGMIRSDKLKDISLNMTINANDLHALNTRSNDNEMFYGQAYVDGTVKLTGSPKSMNYKIDATTERGTRIYLPLNYDSEISEYDYITLKQPGVEETEEKPLNKKADLSGMEMEFNLDLTPDAEIQMIFDSKMGDIIKTEGNGRMKMLVDSKGTFKLIGEYIIEEGDYLFTLQDVLNKKLSIKNGSSIRWSGDPLNADVDIVAVYKTKALLKDILSDDTYNYRASVNCQIYLKDNLMSPDITYDIYLPYEQEDVRDRINSRITSDEEMSRQFLSLLIINRFMPPRGVTNEQQSNSNIAGVNASELLSNQLSNWLSQISNEVDFGVNYRPGNELTSQELEVALSTQFLNDKLSINGSIDMKSDAQTSNTNKLVGDIDIDYKIDKTGKIRVRAFNRSNDDYLIESSPYTQGVGMFFKEEFDSVGELLKRYLAILRKKEKMEVEGEKQKNSSKDTE